MRYSSLHMGLMLAAAAGMASAGPIQLRRVENPDPAPERKPEPLPNPSAPKAHSHAREKARRLRQLEKAAAKRAAKGLQP